MPDAKQTIWWGWNEQNEANFGITKQELPEGVDPNEDYGSKGFWFTEFEQAKQEAINYWNNQLNIAKAAIAAIRATTKNKC